MCRLSSLSSLSSLHAPVSPPLRPPAALAAVLGASLTLTLLLGVVPARAGDETPGKPLSLEAAAYVEAQLYELQQRFDARPPLETLTDYGISRDNDLYEGNRSHGRVPPSAGFASVIEDPGKYNADPVLTLGTAAALRARLGREPTPGEVDEQVAAFDARIRQLNAQLAAQHGQLADAQAHAGRLPMRTLAALAEPFMRPDVVAAPYAKDNAAVSDDARRSANWEIARGLLELLAADR